ncbi:MAG: histidinol-phosphate transaminase [Chlamydiota bacterium]|nr:histidinol-phosphate transaminase [Chlamydiota bacterium]
MNSFFQKHIQDLSAYVPGIQPEGTDYIKLNTNENPYPPSRQVIQALKKASNATLRLYPNPSAEGLRKKIADRFGLDPDCVLIGNGSDELINLIIRSVVGPGDKVFLTYPTYILYDVLVNLQQGSKVIHSLDAQYNLTPPFATDGLKLAFFANPNTPTGTIFQKDILEQFCTQTEALVVIDEAYVDFAKTDCLDFIHRFKNVLITRTFSKSYAMAGLRIGYVLGTPENIRELMKIKDSYNVNRLSAIAAEAAFDDYEYMLKRAQMVIRDRKFLTKQLEKLDFDVLPSEANFVFAKHRRIDAKMIYKMLLDQHILVRHFDLPRLNEFLRISIGTHQEMVKLITALKLNL